MELLVLGLVRSGPVQVLLEYICYLENIFINQTNLVLPFLVLEPVLFLLVPVPRRQLVLVQERPIGQLAQHGLVLALGPALVLEQMVGLVQTELAQLPIVWSCNMPRRNSKNRISLAS